jgi:hypothetical protein
MPKLTQKAWVTVAVLVLSAAGIGLRARTLANLGLQELCGWDFPIFYAGGRLAGTPQLYSADAIRAIEQREAGCSQPPSAFIRLPYFAGVMVPWARLPFWTSFLLWRLSSMAVVLAFIWLWPAPRLWSLLAFAWSMPLGYDLSMGQDSAFLLLWLALGAALLAKGRDFAAGLAFSLLLAKFHLFLLLPVLLLGRRRALWGGALGTALLLAACFLVQGPHWIGQFLGAIGDSGIDNATAFPNLRGLAHGSTAVEVLLTLVVAGAAVYIIRQADFALGMAATLTGGFLISHHMTNSDMVLLVPAALLMVFHPRTGYSKVAAVFLISPVAYFLMSVPGLWEIPRLLMLVQVLLLAWEVRPLRSSRLASGLQLDTIG